MVYLTRIEHFNAAHKLFNPNWSREKNDEVFGRCANENWHGHNFELYVTIKGNPDPDTGFIYDAKKLGANKFVLTSDFAATAKLAGYFDFIVDTVAAKHDVTSAINWLKREGTLIMVGASDKPLDLGVFSLIMKRRKIMGSLIGGVRETQEMLDHCGKHGITSDVELIQASQINEAYERMIQGKVKYRFVIDAKSF